MKSKFLAGVALGLGLAVSAPAYAQLKVGVAGPITGNNATFGAQLKNGAEQAVADINAAGGILGQKIVLTIGDAAFEGLVARVIGFVEAPGIGLDLPLDIRGTAFQERVWQALRQVPPGQTVSYAEIARRIGSPKSVRAVAQACAANRIAVAIPCHRVVRNDGAISGYRWGVARKRALLETEAQA